MQIINKWFPLILLIFFIIVCLWNDEKKIRVYKYLKFILLRLIHDYYGFKINDWFLVCC
jgi:hypothetical protein